MNNNENLDAGRDKSYLFVCHKICDQCLFSDKKIVDEKRKAEVLAECEDNGTYFECHKGTLADRHVMCRGFYNQYPEHTLAMRLAKRWGLEVFVNVQDNFAIVKGPEINNK